MECGEGYDGEAQVAPGSTEKVPNPDLGQGWVWRLEVKKSSPGESGIQAEHYRVSTSYRELGDFSISGLDYTL